MTRGCGVNSRVWLMRVLSVAVIVLIVFLVTGYLGDFSRIRVTVNNTTDYPVAAVAKLNISHSPYFVSSGSYTIPPHTEQVMATWSVDAGSHTILVTWGVNSSHPEPYFFFNDYYLLPHTTKNVVVDASDDTH